MQDVHHKEEFKAFMKSLKHKFLEYDEVHIMEPEIPDHISLFDLALMSNWFEEVMLIGNPPINNGTQK